jgi:hypothetical protein
MDSELLRVVQLGNLPRVKWLLLSAEGGADVQENDIYGQTALMQWLLSVECGANIAASDDLGHTVLSCVAVRWLLSAECEANIREVEFDALLLAANYGHLATAAWLLDYGNADIAVVNARDQSVWDLIRPRLMHSMLNLSPTADYGMRALLRVMVVRSTPPPISWLHAHHWVAEEGARLRAQLPAYL